MRGAAALLAAGCAAAQATKPCGCSCAQYSDCDGSCACGPDTVGGAAGYWCGGDSTKQPADCPTPAPVVTPPPEGQCGAVCNDFVHNCEPTATCNSCMPSPPGQDDTFACFAACGNPCTSSKQCGSANCQYCDTYLGKCRVPSGPTPPAPPTPPPPPPTPCGGACASSADCNGGECTVCVPKNATAFWCSAACGAACTSSDHCGVAWKGGGCTSCTDGKCV